VREVTATIKAEMAEAAKIKARDAKLDAAVEVFKAQWLKKWERTEKAKARRRKAKKK
jgi:hypothetical protein